MKRGLLLLFFLGITTSAGYAADKTKSTSTTTVAISSEPIGSPFFRHMAFDFNLDLREAAKIEKAGFGRTETVTLMLLSKVTGVPIKDYANRRLNDKGGKNAVTLESLSKEAGLDYPTLYKNAQAIKEGIESKGDRNLPAPVYPTKEDKEFLRKETPYGE